jgi:hypothetical protein
VRRALAATALAVALGGCAGAPVSGFDTGRYVAADLAEAEHPADGICNSPVPERPVTILDAALTPLRLRATATQRFHPLPEDASHAFALYDKMTAHRPRPVYDSEVLVRIDGQDRWLPIQSPVRSFWGRQLAEGQPVTLFVTRFACVLGEDAAADRALLTINEYEVEPVGPSESP